MVRNQLAARSEPADRHKRQLLRCALVVGGLLAFWLVGIAGSRYAVYRTCVENLRSCAHFHGGWFHGARAPWNGFATYDAALDQRLRLTGGSAYDVRNYETSLLIVTGLTLALAACAMAFTGLRRYLRCKAHGHDIR